MDLVLDILRTSFLAHFIVPLSGEVAWFAWLNFEKPHLYAATFLALVASGLAYAVSYGCGRLLARDVEALAISEASYARAQKLMRQWFIWLLLFPWVPFLPFFVFAAGFLRTSWRQVLVMVVLNRMIYYGYYIIQQGTVAF